MDIGLYAFSALFAALTATGSTLASHRAWGTVATLGYVVAALAATIQLAIRTARRRASGRGGTASRPSGTRARFGIAVAAFVATGLVPLVIQAVQRAGGRADRAQEEVIVIEQAGQRLMESGTPYLGRADIAALPGPEWLLAYVPYQPAMALFGVPRALGASAWWSDARLFFALATAVALGGALVVLRRAGWDPVALVRGLQVAIIPVCTLTLATGGDDMPVLALCLLAFSFAATGRFGAAGLAVGAASALKLFAWPVAVVLAAHALWRGHVRLREGQAGSDSGSGSGRGGATVYGTGRPALRYLAGAAGPALLTAAPALLIDGPAMLHNVIGFPLGRGLVTSPAASPLPGHLLATSVAGGRAVAMALLATAGLAIAIWLTRRPPQTASAAALVCATGLAAAMMLLPATRFGYLLYPGSFLVWSAVLRPAGVTGHANPSGTTAPGTTATGTTGSGTTGSGTTAGANAGRTQRAGSVTSSHVVGAAGEGTTPPPAAPPRTGHPGPDPPS